MLLTLLQSRGAAPVQPTVERDGRWIRRAAERQQYVYYRRARIAEKAPPAAAAAIEQVLEQAEDQPSAALHADQAQEALARELTRRGIERAQVYVDALQDELALLAERRATDDDDAVQAALVALLH